MKHVTLVIACAVLLTLAVDSSVAKDRAKKPKAGALPLCPVMGEPVNFAVKTATAEGNVYFCCAGCVKKYNADPSAYAGKVAAQRTVLAKLPKVQVKCPVTGEPVKPKLTVEHNGETIAMCCKRCVGKFKADPDKYKSGLGDAYTYQAFCPVMGGKINPTAFTTLPTGDTVYYCCMGCDKKLLGAPEKYNQKLLDQGIHIDWKKVKELSVKKSAGRVHDGHEGHDH